MNRVSSSLTTKQSHTLYEYLERALRARNLDVIDTVQRMCTQTPEQLDKQRDLCSTILYNESDPETIGVIGTHIARGADLNAPYTSCSPLHLACFSQDDCGIYMAG